MSEYAKKGKRGFQKGNPGRRKGTRDKKTDAWHRLGEYLINDGADKYLDIISDLDNDKYLREFQAMLEYFKPKQQRADKNGDQSISININVDTDDTQV